MIATATRRLTIQERFDKFDRDNPHIYELIKRFAFEALRSVKHYSIRAIFERIRWHLNVETQTDERFRISDNFTSRYVRKLIFQYPEFNDFFTTKELRTP